MEVFNLYVAPGAFKVAVIDGRVYSRGRVEVPPGTLVVTGNARKGAEALSLRVSRVVDNHLEDLGSFAREVQLEAMRAVTSALTGIEMLIAFAYQAAWLAASYAKEVRARSALASVPKRAQAARKTQRRPYGLAARAAVSA